MATATIASGLTRLTACETADNAHWTNVGGGAGSSQDDDIWKEGSEARSRRADNKDGHGFCLDYYSKTSTTVDLTNTHVWMWFACLQPSSLYTIANGGVRIRISSNTSGLAMTNFNDYYVAGSDTYGGGWVRLCIDTSKTPSATNGTCVLSAVGIVGIVISIGDVGGSTNNMIVDCIDYGDGMVVRGGTSGDRLTFDDIATADTGDTTKPNYGVVEKKASVYFCLGKLQLGESTGTNDMYFEDKNQILSWQERQLYETSLKTALGAGHNKLVVLGSGSVGQDIHFTDGIEVGSGDDASGRSGSIFMQEEGNLFGNLTIDLDDANVQYIKLYGSMIRRADQGLTFSSDSTNGPNHRLSGVVIDNCSQADIGRIKTRNCLFSGYTPDTDGALLWNANIDIKNSRIFGNTDVTNDPHGIEHPAAGAFTYDNLTFSGNDYDIYFTAASDDLTINATNGADPVTSEVSGTGSVSIINTVTLSVHVEDKDGNDIQYAQVYVQKPIPDEYASHATNNDKGDSTLEASGSFGGDVPSNGWVIVKPASGRQQNYQYASKSGAILTLKTAISDACTGGGTSTSLQDSVNDFTAMDIAEGVVVRNVTDGSWTLVDEIVDASNITTESLMGGSDNTWTSGDTYSFHTLATDLHSTGKIYVPFLNDQTDATGDVSANHNYSSGKTVDIKVRHSSDATKYLSVSTSGNITSGGMSVIVIMTVDPNVD